MLSWCGAKNPPPPPRKTAPDGWDHSTFELGSPRTEVRSVTVCVKLLCPRDEQPELVTDHTVIWLQYDYYVMTHRNATEGNCRGNRRMEWEVSNAHSNVEQSLFSVSTHAAS